MKMGSSKSAIHSSTARSLVMIAAACRSTTYRSTRRPAVPGGCARSPASAKASVWGYTLHRLRELPYQSRGMPTTVAIVLAKSVSPGLRRCGSDLIPVYCPQRHVSEEMRVLVALA